MSVTFVKMLPLCAYLIKLLHIEQIRNRSLFDTSIWFPIVFQYSSSPLQLQHHWLRATDICSIAGWLSVDWLTVSSAAHFLCLSRRLSFKLVVLFYCFCIHELLQSEQFCLVAVFPLASHQFYHNWTMKRYSPITCNISVCWRHSHIQTQRVCLSMLTTHNTEEQKGQIWLSKKTCV